MALTGALCQTLLAATGFTNKSLRVLIAGLLGSDYRANQMTYDLRRLGWPGSSAASPAPTDTGSPTTASGSPSSTPSSTTGSSPRSSQPTNRKHPATCALHYPQSTNTSRTT
jgi:hypothetical protein